MDVAVVGLFPILFGYSAGKVFSVCEGTARNESNVFQWTGKFA